MSTFLNDKMNADVKAKWVAALRSGNYEQGEGALQTVNGFCCLGVLCDLAVREGVIDAPTKAEIDYGKDVGTVTTYLYPAYIDGDDEREHSYLPEAVSTWAHINRHGNRDRDPATNGYRPSLAALNDDGKTFSEIADVIEQEF